MSIDHHMQNPVMDRRQFTLGSILTGLFLGYFSGSANAQKAPQVAGYAKQVPELTLEQVARDLQRKPREILQDAPGITFIDYDPQGKWKQKYFSEVFQEGVKDKKPVLALFYDEDRSGNHYVQGAAIVLRELNRTYGDKIKFIALSLPSNGASTEYHEMSKAAKIGGHGPISNDYMGIFKNKDVRKLKYLPPIRGPPSIALYAGWDVAEGETPSKNDGKIKLIDVMSGAPGTRDGPKEVNRRISDAIDYWIGPNVFMQNTPEGDFNVYRISNSLEKWKIVGNTSGS